MTETSPPEPEATLPDERPQRRREYSGAGSTMGVAVLLIASVALLIWYFEFRADGVTTGSNGSFGIIDLPADQNPTGRAPSAEPGRAAPNFILQSPGGGEASLLDWRGDYVLLNFWASWCGPCRGEAPDLQDLHEAGDGRLVVVGVNIQERDSDATEFVETFGLTYPIVMDRSGEVTGAYRARTPPTSLLVGPDGTVLRVWFGALSRDDISTLLAEYLTQ